MSISRACKALKLDRSTYDYDPIAQVRMPSKGSAMPALATAVAVFISLFVAMAAIKASTRRAASIANIDDHWPTTRTNETWATGFVQNQLATDAGFACP